MLKFLLIASISIVFRIDCARILGIFPTSLSGDGMGIDLMNGLVQRGHNVTALNLFPVEEYYGYRRTRNYSEESLIESTWPVFLEMAAEPNTKIRKCPFDKMGHIHERSLEITRRLLTDDTIKSLIEKSNTTKEFDLLLMEYHLNDAALILGKLLNVPIVLFSSTPNSFYANYLFANPTPSSYIPNIYTGYTGIMSFGRRIKNSFYNSFELMYRQFVMIPNHEKLIRETTGIETELSTLNVDLILLNSHPAVNVPMPLMPNMVQIGGFHIKNEVILPTILREYLDRADKGVIYFSMRFRRKDLETLRSLARALGKLEQEVLWHFQEEGLDTPDNFKLLKSFDFFVGSIEEIQQGILAHPNTVAFFTQGDMSDLIEAVYNAVPIITMPVTPDQISSSNEIVEKGYGVEISEINDDSITFAVDEILNNIDYLRNIKLVSDIISEGPVNLMHLAMKWIEITARHKELKHLRSPGVKLAWYQRNKLDIILLLVVVDVALFLIFYYIVKHIIRVCRKRKQRNTKSDKSYAKLDEEQ